MHSSGLYLDDPAGKLTFYEHLCKHVNTIKYDLHSVTRRQLKKQFSRNVLLLVHVSLENGATIRINIYVLPCATFKLFTHTEIAYGCIAKEKYCRTNLMANRTNRYHRNDSVETKPCRKANISANGNLECSWPHPLKPVTRPYTHPYKLSPHRRRLFPS